MVTAIIAAAGQGKRMGGGINKVFIPLFDCPVLVHTVKALSACTEVDRLIIIASNGDIGQMEALLRAVPDIKPWQIVEGGSERQFSIANALAVLEEEVDTVLVHDAARPLVNINVISNVIANARNYGAAGVAVPVKDTIKVVNMDGFITDTPDRKLLWAIQTPQAFEAKLLRKAYNKAFEDGFLGTDDASLVERLGIRVKVVAGDYSNIKITTPDDLIVAKALLRQGRESMVRVGMGYDVHRLVTGRKLILGGVEIPHSEGLDGHSDADVLLHAIMDALLGAAALGDIGRHFSDSDNRFKGISSLLLLEKVVSILSERNYTVNNLDATVVAEKPKLAPYIAAMNSNIAHTLKVPVTNINVKATTTEGLGFAGKKEGIAAYAIVSLVEVSNISIAKINQ